MISTFFGLSSLLKQNSFPAFPDCPSPMFYIDCSSADPGVPGSECQKSCKTQDMQCVRAKFLVERVVIYESQGKCI